MSKFLKSNSIDLDSYYDNSDYADFKSNINRNEGKINPFAGTDYADLWINNPYATLYYKPTFWDNIGFSNKAKDANSEYERLYNEYISSIYDQQREDEYNSPLAESQRMKEAGLNPDLLGLSGHSNTSGLDPINSGSNPALNGVSPLHSVFSTLTNVLGFATSSMQAIHAIKGMSEDNLSKSLGNFSTLMGEAEPHIVNEYARRFSGEEAQNWSDIADTSSMSLNLSRRNSIRYKKAFTSLLSSSKYTAAESAYKSINANDKAMYDYIGKMAELSYLAQKHQFKGDISRAAFDANYFKHLNAEEAAKGTNRENKNKGWLDKWRNDFYRQLWFDYQNGSELAGLLLTGSTGLPALGASWISGGAEMLSNIFGKSK